MNFSSRRHLILALLLAVMMAGCSLPSFLDTTTTSSVSADTGGSPETVPPTTLPPATPPTTQPTDTSSVGGDFETVACGESTGHLLCEAYELIQRHYVDVIPAGALADGAVQALELGEVPPGPGIETCPLPNQHFVMVCEEIDTESLDPVSAEEVAVAGMALYALDPNSSYFDAEALALIQEEQSGEIEGIGALVATMTDGNAQPNACQVISDTCRLEILSTIEGGPARAADLQPGDQFVAVDGQSIDGWNVEEVTAAVRGEAGTEVALTMLRDGSEFTITIVRAEVQVPVVTSEMVGDVAYVRLNLFTENADEQLHEELDELLANQPTSLVLDLRSNPGGLLDTSINVASEFLDAGVVVSTQSPESTTPYEVEPGGLLTESDLPVYVVVNRGSASASEVVAGALADYDRATIVGENTFGKNTVQQRFPLSNGGALKLTIARWFTPDGHDFGENGITPDVTAQLPETLTVPELVQEVIPAA